MNYAGLYYLIILLDKLSCAGHEIAALGIIGLALIGVIILFSIIPYAADNNLDGLLELGSKLKVKIISFSCISFILVGSILQVIIRPYGLGYCRWLAWLHFRKDVLGRVLWVKW